MKRGYKRRWNRKPVPWMGSNKFVEAMWRQGESMTRLWSAPFMDDSKHEERKISRGYLPARNGAVVVFNKWNARDGTDPSSSS